MVFFVFGESAQVKIGFTVVLAVFALLSVVVAQEIAQQEEQPIGGTGLVTEAGQDGETVPGEMVPETQKDDETVPDDLVPENLPGEIVPFLELKIASPLYGEIISGTGVVILAVEPRDKITSAFFEIGGLRGELSASNNFSAEFDSKTLPDADYELSVTACINAACKSETIPVTVQNALGNAEPQVTPSLVQSPGSGPSPEVIPRTVKVKGANVFSAMTVFSLDGTVAASGTDFVELKPGVYNVQIDFFDSSLYSLFLKEISIQKDGFVAETSVIDAALTDKPAQDLDWIETRALKANHFFSDGKLVLLPPPLSAYLYRCRNLDYESKNCRGEFEKVSIVLPMEKFSVPFNNNPKGFAFAKKSVKGQLVPKPDLNATVSITTRKVTDLNASPDSNDLLGINFGQMHENLPEGLYSIWDTESMASADEVAAPNFPYYSVEINPFTGKKSFVIDTVKYSEKWFESRTPATKLVPVEAGALYELYLEFYYPQGKDFDSDNLSAYLAEFTETGGLGAGDIVHFKNEGLLAGNQNFEITYADISSPDGVEKNPAVDSAKKDSTPVADSAKSDPILAPDSGEKNSLTTANTFSGKKLAARFRASEESKFMRISFVFDKQELSAINGGSFYFDSITLNKVEGK
ncbi:MAG: hypothetical protein Q7K34_00725 [archaeon]|nr:hypothetical protein [archaeon]